MKDGWSSNHFLDLNNSDYIHEVHDHDQNGNFGFYSYSTSIIEGAWGTLKSSIKQIFGLIP